MKRTHLLAALITALMFALVALSSRAAEAPAPQEGA